MAGTLIAIASGLGAALCFGAGDFLAQGLTRRHGWLPAMFAVQLASVIALVLVAGIWHGSPRASGEALATLVGLGLVNTLGMVGLYRAFESGQLSLVSPIAGSMGAFTVGFAWLLGRPPPTIVAPGLVAVVVGIVVASVVDEGEGEPGARGPRLRAALGIGWALLSALAFGWVFFRLGAASRELGSAWAVAILRVVAIVALLGLARPLRARLDAVWRPPPSPRGEPGPSPTPSTARTWAVACCDSAGMVVFAWGSGRGALVGEVAVVAVLASCFPLVTIALARVRLGEALRWWQWLGVALVVAGVAWVSARSAGA